MEISHLHALISLVALAIIVSKFISRHAAKPSNTAPHARRGLRAPPGPPALPVVGHLTQLGPLPHRSLRRLSDVYGPLMYLQLGQIPTVVVSSAAAAQEVLKTQDLSFCTRPPLSSVRNIFYGGLDIAFTPYNALWRQARRICCTELLSASRVRLFRPIREQEIDALMNTIQLHPSSSSSSSMNLSEMFVSLLNNITCREVFGKKLVDGECGRNKFHDLVTEFTRLMGHFNVGEYFPSMEWINYFTGLHGRFKRNFQDIDAFLDEVIDAHLADSDEGVELEHDYLISVLLRLQKDPTLEVPLTKQHVKAILMDLFIAGTDTGSVALEWGMAELMRNPRVRHKVQSEIRSAVGPKRKVEEDDLHKLDYLKLVVKEILRLHPPAPFLLPRESRRDCRVGGFDIPARTRVSVNVWAIGRDAREWGADAEEFLPERFQDSPVDFRGQHFEMLPFGAGRRGCPGVALGSVVVELALANLLHAFDWYVEERMKEEELDMGELFGIVVRRKSPLCLVAVPHVTQRSVSN